MLEVQRLFLPVRSVVYGLALCLSACAGPVGLNQQQLVQYKHDGLGCRNESAVLLPVRLNVAGVADMTLDAGYNQERFRGCMARLGWSDENATESWLAAQKDCQARTARASTAVRTRRDVTLAGSRDPDEFNDCMGGRRVEVELMPGQIDGVESAPDGKTP